MAGVFLLVGFSSTSASASGCGTGPRPDAELRSVEQQLLSMANNARASAGGAALGSHGEVTRIARDHAVLMAAQGRIFHNDLFFSGIGSLGASMLAENVGKGCSASGLHDAFMASASHRANIMNGNLTHAGVAAATDVTGTLYVVQGFGAFAPAAPPPPPPAAAVTPPPTEAPVVRQASAPAPVRPAAEPAPVAVASEAPVSEPAPAQELRKPVVMGDDATLEQRAAVAGRGIVAQVRAASIPVTTSMATASSHVIPAAALTALLGAMALSLAVNRVGLSRRKRSGVWSVTR